MFWLSLKIKQLEIHTLNILKSSSAVIRICEQSERASIPAPEGQIFGIRYATSSNWRVPRLCSIFARPLHAPQFEISKSKVQHRASNQIDRRCEQDAAVIDKEKTSLSGSGLYKASKRPCAPSGFIQFTRLGKRGEYTTGVQFDA